MGLRVLSRDGCLQHTEIESKLFQYISSSGSNETFCKSSQQTLSTGEPHTAKLLAIYVEQEVNDVANSKNGI